MTLIFNYCILGKLIFDSMHNKSFQFQINDAAPGSTLSYSIALDALRNCEMGEVYENKTGL